MKAMVKNSIILMGLVLAGGTVIAEKSACAVVSVTTSVPTGAALYAQNCGNCHGALTSSTKIGADANRIQSAITGNAGGMGFLTTLTATETQAIATAIAQVPIGAALYTSSCLSCHGGLSTTFKAGADSTRIQNAIAYNSGGMGSLSTLAALQVQAIASTLAVATSGTLLYVNNCAGCHGIITNSAKIGADSSRTQNAISLNTGGMGFLSILSATDIQAIAAVLTAP